jgi:hypothetical protein
MRSRGGTYILSREFPPNAVGIMGIIVLQVDAKNILIIGLTFHKPK